MDRPSNKGVAALRAVHMGLYPTLDTLESVVDLAKSQVPVISQNDVVSILMTYHNTLLKVMNKDNEHVTTVD